MYKGSSFCKNCYRRREGLYNSMTVKLTLKNLKTFITGTPVAFLVVLLTEILAAVGIIMTYGIVRNVFTEQERESVYSRELNYNKDEDIAIDADDPEKQYRDFGTLINNDCAGLLNRAYLYGYVYEGMSRYFICLTKYFEESAPYVSREEISRYRSGENIVTVKSSVLQCSKGGSVELFGDTYTVFDVGDSSVMTVDFGFAYDNAPKKLALSGLQLHFKDIPSKEQAEDIMSSIEGYFGHSESVALPKVPDLLVRQFNSTMLAGCAAAMVLIVINSVSLYMFILRRRSNWLSVVKLCGCKNRALIGIFMLEMALVSLAGYGTGQLICGRIIIPALSGYYPAFDSVYSPRAFAFIFAGYILVSAAVMLIRLTMFVSLRAIYLSPLR